MIQLIKRVNDVCIFYNIISGFNHEKEICQLFRFKMVKAQKYSLLAAIWPFDRVADLEIECGRMAISNGWKIV